MTSQNTNSGTQVACTPINKQLAVLTHGSRHDIIANPYEAAKAYVIAAAEGKLDKHLPYAISVYPMPTDDPDLCPQGWSLAHCRELLTSDNPPGKVNFRSNAKLLRELVEPLDFSKPYDKELVVSIRARFEGGAVKKVEIDAVDIEEATNE